MATYDDIVTNLRRDGMFFTCQNGHGMTSGYLSATIARRFAKISGSGIRLNPTLLRHKAVSLVCNETLIVH